MTRPPLPIRMLLAATLGAHALRKLGQLRRRVLQRNAGEDAGAEEPGLFAPWHPRRRRGTP